MAEHENHSPTQVTHFLKGTDFPAGRDDLLETAKANKAGDDVLDQIGRMPDQEYHTMADVMKGFGASR